MDPVNLFSEIDWTCFEDDVQVINKIYSKYFEDVVLLGKKLVCFWPLAEQMGEEWFELSSLCKSYSYDLEQYKSLSIVDFEYGFNQEILSSWKRFVYFIVESLLEDIQLNEQFDEIATLKSDQKTIILFKLFKEGKVSYSYAFDSFFFESDSDKGEKSEMNLPCQESFTSFNEMLDKLIKENDLSQFESRFVDGSLEKAFFSVLSKEFKTKNLIETWIKTYSIN
ncbi:hypothetical protein [Algoriphagus litoralis]|uniref:hypothetical protein n=1 Tax=Algoriphagus litoralis TaxID=2202829 RepID=UPI001E31E9A3|nr:hypothetical protein [Algoriphagus litoralis]